MTDQKPQTNVPPASVTRFALLLDVPETAIFTGGSPSTMVLLGVTKDGAVMQFNKTTREWLYFPGGGR